MKKLIVILLILMVGIMAYSWNGMSEYMIKYWNSNYIPYVQLESGAKISISDNDTIYLGVLSEYPKSFFIMIDDNASTDDIANIIEYDWKFPYSDIFVRYLVGNMFNSLTVMIEEDKLTHNTQKWIYDKFVTIKVEYRNGTTLFQFDY